MGLLGDRGWSWGQGQMGWSWSCWGMQELGTWNGAGAAGDLQDDLDLLEVRGTGTPGFTLSLTHLCDP